MHVLLAPFGTEGDVRPLVALADAMAARGHRISFLANPHFARAVRGPGWHFIPLGTAQSYGEYLSNPRIWRPVAGIFAFLEIMERSLELAFAALDAVGERFDLVVGNTVSIPALTWAERAGVPRLLLHLQPLPLRSRTDVPLLAPGLEWATRLSPRAAGVWFRALDATSRPLLRGINAFRRRHGLPALPAYETLWRNAEGIAALFPPWLAPPQPDWPRNTRQFDALRRHPGHAEPLPDTVERFLQGGDPPVVWTQGSYHVNLDRFAKLAGAVTMQLGMRGIVLGRPAAEDAGRMLLAPYVPLATLLPRARALVHHGGIGTGFEAIAAGIPQLILPRAADQFDNARRFAAAGAAATVASRRPGVAMVSEALRALLASASSGAPARPPAGTDPAADLCRYAEAIGAGAKPA